MTTRDRIRGMLAYLEANGRKASCLGWVSGGDGSTDFYVSEDGSVSRQKWTGYKREYDFVPADDRDMKSLEEALLERCKRCIQDNLVNNELSKLGFI